MPISSYLIRTSRVSLGKDNDFEVRALTFPDIIAAVSSHMPALIAIVSKSQEADGDIYTKMNTSQMAMMVARDFPSVATEIISMCVVGETMDEAARSKVAMLPAPISMNALLSIFRLTVEEAGGLGNLVADLRQHVQSVMTSGESPSQNA